MCNANEYNYSLQRYTGPASRYTCPNCGAKHSFTRYVDAKGEFLHETVGRCDHESSCNYHYTPREYFRDHPEARPSAEDWRKAPEWLQRSVHSCPPVHPCLSLKNVDSQTASKNVYKLLIPQRSILRQSD